MQSIEEANALAVCENIDVRSDISPFVHDPIEYAGRASTERCQRIAYGRARLIDLNSRLSIDSQSKGLRQFDRNHR